MKKYLISSLALGSLFFTGAAAKAAVIVDTFDEGNVYEIISGGVNSASGTASGAGIIGGTRQYLLQKTVGTGRGNTATLDIDDVPGGGSPDFKLNNTTGTVSIATLTYNTGAPYDLSTESRFSFNILSNDLGGDVTITVNGTSYTTNTGAGTSGRFEVPFSQFPGVNFSSINEIKFSVTGPPDLDFQMDQFQADNIPEPLTILGTAFALTTLPVLKKAHSKKKA